MCEISCKNSERLLRKQQKTLGDTFFAAHCILPVKQKFSFSLHAPKYMLENINTVEI